MSPVGKGRVAMVAGAVGALALSALTLSADDLVELLTREDIKLQAYADPVHGWKVPTIGAGSTAGVKQGDTITPLQAVQRARQELRQFEDGVKACLPQDVKLYPSEYGAYTQLAHNIGLRNFCTNPATGGPGLIPRTLATGDHAAACKGILAYDRAGPVNKPEDRCSHPDNRTCRGLWAERQRLYAKCISDHQ